MSERGSPSDHAENVNTEATGDALASATAGTDVDASGSGDANLSADASSASGDQGAKEQPKATLADVIKTAAELPDAEGKSPAPAKDGKDTNAEGADAAAKADGDKAATDDSKLPFHNHPRWKEVIAENKDLRPKAEQFSKITEFMDQHNLNHEEVGEGFIIMAMIKAGDPRGLAKLDEYRDKLALALGEKLPDDIAEQVESGAITEGAGKELAKTRAKSARTEADNARLRDQDNQRRQNDEATTLATQCQGAVTKWEADVRKTDPDFAKKEKAVARYARALMQEKGFPKSADDAVALMKEAYGEVNKDFAAAIPPKQPARHVSSAPSSNGAKPAPKNLADVVRQAASQ